MGGLASRLLSACQGVGGSLAPFLSLLLGLVGLPEFFACLLKVLFGSGYLLAGLVVPVACPLPQGVGVRLGRTLGAEALLGRLGCLSGSGEFLLPSAAPVGEFVLRSGSRRRRAVVREGGLRDGLAVGVVPEGNVDGGVRADVRWPVAHWSAASWSASTASRVDSTSCCALSDSPCPASRASWAACRDRAATTRRRCAESSLTPSASRVW